MTTSEPKTLAKYKAPYPEPTADQKRCAIFLDEKENEENYQIELIPGRVQQVDGVNHHWLMGSIDKKEVKGWGFPYYIVNMGDGCASTRMAVIPGQEREEFVQMDMPMLMRYNSKLPLVVYIPKDAELRYRIWEARSPVNTDPQVQEV